MKKAGELVFQGTACDVYIGKYGNDLPAIRLFDKEDGMPFLTATVFLNELIPDDHVFIKNYSENKGIMESLINSGIIAEPVGVSQQTFVKLYICKLLK